MIEWFFFLFELGSNIVILMIIVEYGKYIDIEEDKLSRIVGNLNMIYIM